MMLTSEKFETAAAAFRSRFISPVFNLNNNQDDFCVNVKYHIYGQDTDGFKLIIENYLNGNEFITLSEIRGPLSINMWHSQYIQVKSVTFSQFRVNMHTFLYIFNDFVFCFGHTAFLLLSFQ